VRRDVRWMLLLMAVALELPSCGSGSSSVADSTGYVAAAARREACYHGLWAWSVADWVSNTTVPTIRRTSFSPILESEWQSDAAFALTQGLLEDQVLFVAGHVTGSKRTALSNMARVAVDFKAALESEHPRALAAAAGRLKQSWVALRSALDCMSI
jgi:hypothetical protein